MRRRGLQLSRSHRWTLYAFSVALLLSGAAWAWIHRFGNDAQPDGALRQLGPWLLEAHGYAALGFVLLLGTLLPGHVRRSWHARKNRTNGAFFLTVVSLLTLSGYTLYYLGGETSRQATSLFHLWLGLAAPVLLVWHIRTGRRQTGSTSKLSKPSQSLHMN